MIALVGGDGLGRYGVLKIRLNCRKLGQYSMFYIHNCRCQDGKLVTFGSGTIICPEKDCVFRSRFPKLGVFEQEICMR